MLRFFNLQMIWCANCPQTQFNVHRRTVLGNKPEEEWICVPQLLEPDLLATTYVRAKQVAEKLMLCVRARL
jgi:hypothetical protein